MSHSEHMNELAAALSKAQGRMKAASFNKINPHFKSKYADLAAVWEAIREPLSSNGLSVTQTEDSENGRWVLRTTLWHTSGQWVSSAHPLPHDVTPQQFGSALTYARRYALSALVGIAADEDDDANEAQKASSIATPPEGVAKMIAASAPLDAGEPRELPLGDDMDQEGWVRIGQQLIAAAARPDWVEWEKMNGLSMARMANEAPKVYARMIAAIARG